MTATMADVFEDDLKALKAQLDVRNVRIGEVIGAGDMGGITYNLLDAKGEVIPSVVMRIDPAEMVTPLDVANPGAIRPIHREEAGYYAATIVPRAKPLSHGFATKEEALETLAVMNVDGLFPHMKDLGLHQFMKIPGIDVPVLTDLSCVSREANTNQGMGTVDTFVEMLGADKNEVKAKKASPETMAKLRAAQDAIHERALGELKAAGVDIEPVPVRQSGAKLDALEEKHRATGKQ